MTPNIIQTMKQTVNASVLTIRTDQARGGMAAGDEEAEVAMAVLFLSFGRWEHFRRAAGG
jgi:hypothetical protein